MDKVAVVILNWNGAEMLRRYLPGVLVHTRGEVYVADNASTDESLEVLRNEFPTVKTILLDRNYGFAEGYNRALDQVDAEYSVLLNSDVEVHNDWVSPMLEYLERHPDVAACQPKIRSWCMPEMFEYAGAAGGFMDYLGYPFCRGRVFDTVEVDDGQYDRPVSVLWATGAALMVRTAVYRKVGGLDGRFFAHMEEIDFCWRLRSRGYGIVCVPAATVFHYGGGTLPKDNPRKTYLNFRNNLYMLYKNLPEKRLRPVMRWRYWLDRLAALQFLLKGEFRCFREVLRARSDFSKMKKELHLSRMENLLQTTVDDIPEILPYSVLWAYYMKKKHHYSEIMNK